MSVELRSHFIADNKLFHSKKDPEQSKGCLLTSSYSISLSLRSDGGIAKPRLSYIHKMPSVAIPVLIPLCPWMAHVTQF